MKEWVIVGAVSSIIIAAVCSSAYIQKRIEHAEIVVTGKERVSVVESDRDGKTKTEIHSYVYAENEMYIVEDSAWNWHFTSGTVYAKINTGKCHVTLSGIRWGLFSMYQNIIDADCDA